MTLLQENGFLFCPNCKAQNFEFTWKNMHCKSCEFVYYQNAAAAVGIIIFRKFINSEGYEVLLAIRAKNPSKGQQDLPGGFVDPGENLEQALFRELEEELGLDICNKIALPEYLCSSSNSYYYKNKVYPVCDVFFQAELLTEAQIIAMDDVEHFIWVGAHKINFDNLAFPSTGVALRFWQKRFIG